MFGKRGKQKSLGCADLKGFGKSLPCATPGPCMVFAQQVGGASRGDADNDQFLPLGPPCPGHLL